MIFDNFLKYVEDGRKGLNKGIPMGFPRLDKFLRGLQRKKYYLIGANTGIGKTAFVDQAFIINPYNWIVKNEAKESIKVFYYSFEIDTESKIAKWVSYQLYMDERISVDPEYILGMDMESETDTKNRLNDELFEKIKAYKEHFDKMMEYITFEDVPMNPTAIFKQVQGYCESVGTHVKYNRVIGGKEKEISYYRANNTNEYVLVIIDHIGLLRNEKTKGESSSKKQNIDKMSTYLIELRNKYKVIPVVISQFNREMGDIQRQRFKELTPQLEDFKDSGNTQEDCNVAIALFSPKRYNIPRYLDYDLKGPGYDVLDHFRAAFVVKNRGGRDGASLGMRFLGHCGYFEEIPLPKDFEENSDYYKLMSDFTKPFNTLIQERNTKKGKLL